MSSIPWNSGPRAVGPGSNCCWRCGENAARYAAICGTSPAAWTSLSCSSETVSSSTSGGIVASSASSVAPVSIRLRSVYAVASAIRIVLLPA